jgi:SAM-dependent MidA family methyltransferase
MAPDIATVIRNEIQQRRVIPFSRFTELALYHPKLGYYERSPNSIGAHRDFITSVSVGSVFGYLLASQFTAWASNMGLKALEIIECGAHDGRLACDVLTWIKCHAPEWWPDLKYCIIEPSLERRSWQRKLLFEYSDQTTWHESVNDIPCRSVSGIIFSNEFLDAFPVTRLRWNARLFSWEELGVEWRDQTFSWQIIPTDTQRWRNELSNAGFEIATEVEQVIPDGFLIDLAIGAKSWWQSASQLLVKGRIMTIDYGWTAKEFLNPSRSCGSLRSYRSHSVQADCLRNVGAQDLTAHVNFSQIVKAGESVGLQTEFFLEQWKFLSEIAGNLLKRNLVQNSEFNRQFSTLTHPNAFGTQFRVLVQKTTVPPD